MPLVPLLVAAALAAGDSDHSGAFDHVRDQAGCWIGMRPATDPEGVAMRAECHWPEVDPAALVGMLGRYERYPDFVFPIDVAEVRRTDGDRALVYQRQSMIGIADREVLLWITRQQDGAKTTFAWSAAADEPLQLRPGAIRTPRNTGYWSVEADGAGGSLVVHQIAMDAGGSIPEWIVNLVRTRSFAKIMSDVRSAAAPGLLAAPPGTPASTDDGSREPDPPRPS